jgi:histidine triad (HIT) family protein
MHPDFKAGQAIGGDMASYDSNNIFAKILRGELPSYKVYEDSSVLAFLDIMPRSVGHTLVIPKNPARNVLDISEDDFVCVARATRKIAVASISAFNADGVSIEQANETAGGQVVFHLHMHVMPRRNGVSLAAPMSHKEDPVILEKHATKLVKALSS